MTFPTAHILTHHLHPPARISTRPRIGACPQSQTTYHATSLPITRRHLQLPLTSRHRWPRLRSSPRARLPTPRRPTIREYVSSQSQAGAQYSHSAPFRQKPASTSRNRDQGAPRCRQSASQHLLHPTRRRGLKSRCHPHLSVTRFPPPQIPLLRRRGNGPSDKPKPSSPQPAATEQSSRSLTILSGRNWPR